MIRKRKQSRTWMAQVVCRTQQPVRRDNFKHLISLSCLSVILLQISRPIDCQQEARPSSPPAVAHFRPIMQPFVRAQQQAQEGARYVLNGHQAFHLAQLAAAAAHQRQSHHFRRATPAQQLAFQVDETSQPQAADGRAPRQAANKHSASRVEAGESGGGKMLICYYTTRQRAPYWPADSREFMVPADELNEAIPLDAANDERQQAAVEREQKQRHHSSNDYRQNPSQLLIKTPRTRSQLRQLFAGGQMVVISPPAFHVPHSPHLSAKSSPEPIVENQLDARQDGQDAHWRRRQQPQQRPLGALASANNSQTALNKQQVVQRQQQNPDNGLFVGAASFQAPVHQPIGAAASRQALMTMSPSLLLEATNNGANSNNRDHPEAARNLQLRQPPVSAIQWMGRGTPATTPMDFGAGVRQGTKLDGKQQLLVASVGAQREMGQSEAGRRDSQAAANSPPAAHPQGGKSLLQAAGSATPSPTSSLGPRVVFNGATVAFAAPASPAQPFGVSAPALAPSSPMVGGPMASGAASDLTASTASGALEKLSASTMSVDFAPSNLVSYTLSPSAAAAAAAASATIHQQQRRRQQHQKLRQQPLADTATTADDERRLMVNDGTISTSTAPIAPSSPIAASAASTSMTSSTIGGGGGEVAAATGVGSSTAGAAASRATSMSYAMLDNARDTNSGAARQQQPTSSLSSALVSSPLATMFDVFGAASQYLMRFKPSSLVSPSSFGASFNNLMGDHGQTTNGVRFGQDGAGGGQLNHLKNNSSSLLTSSFITLPFGGGAMHKPSAILASNERSSSHAGTLSSSLSGKTPAGGGGGFFSRLAIMQRSQRREEICGRTIQTPERRIIGGEGARYGEFPYQVHIKIAKHQCGGALVDKQSIVTAAHCVYHFITRAPVSKLQIVIGAYDIEDEQYQELPAQYFKVNKVKLHPNFRFSASHPDRYDVAILKLDKPVKYADNVLPVCLPSKDLKFESMVGTVTGFGKTDPSLSNRYGTRLLQKVDVPIIENSECERWHRTRGIDLKIFPEMMCAGYEDGLKDACVGDSGGPLVVKSPVGSNGSFRWTLAGITSAGFGCAQSRQPGIYHRVSHTVDWILENLD